MASKPKSATNAEADPETKTEIATETAAATSPIAAVTEVKHAAAGAEPVVDGDTVTMLFQKPVGVIHNGIMHRFKAGLQQVPLELAGRTDDDMHWYLKDNDVKRAK